MTHSLPTDGFCSHWISRVLELENRVIRFYRNFIIHSSSEANRRIGYVGFHAFVSSFECGWYMWCF